MIILALLIPALAIAGTNTHRQTASISAPTSQSTAKDTLTATEEQKTRQAGAQDCRLPSTSPNDALDSIRLNYEKQAAEDPNNAATLLALATMEERRNNPKDAEQLRQQALLANPQSPEVMASIIATQTGRRARQDAESHLRSWLAAHPRSAALHFALGNLLAQQGRWDEAEPAYFNAVTNEAGNPDFLFNLAVSLDRLRQYGLASQHYLQALEAAQKRPAGFDPDQAHRRLTELQQAPLSRP